MKFKSLPYSKDGVVLIGILPSGKDIELPFNRDSIIPKPLSDIKVLS